MSTEITRPNSFILTDVETSSSTKTQTIGEWNDDIETNAADIATNAANITGKANTVHTHTLSDITDSGTAASKDFPATGDAAADEVVLGNDSRLTGSAPTISANYLEIGDVVFEWGSLTGLGGTPTTVTRAFPTFSQVFYTGAIQTEENSGTFQNIQIFDETATTFKIQIEAGTTRTANYFCFGQKT